MACMKSFHVILLLHLAVAAHVCAFCQPVGYQCRSSSCWPPTAATFNSRRMMLSSTTSSPSLATTKMAGAGQAREPAPAAREHGKGGLSRKHFLSSASAALMALPWVVSAAKPKDAHAAWFVFSKSAIGDGETLSTVGKVSPTGVKYYDYKEGTGPSPQFGQAVSLRWELWGQLSPAREMEFVDKSDNNGELFLMKHGNGRQLKGMEEGLHTMKVGGKRRIIIPPSLAYVVPGLGPLPSEWFRRRTLNKLLDDMEQQQTATGRQDGVFVMDIELVEAYDDEADQGYYQDDGLTIEEIKIFSERTQQLMGTEKLRMEALPGTNPVDFMDAES